MNEYDYDPYRLKALKPACARIITDNGQGTGFAIGGSRVLTCAHVVKNSATGGPALRCQFGDLRQAVDCRVLYRDSVADVALLEPVEATALGGIKPPSLAPAKLVFQYWWSWGFPALVDGLGIPLFGYLADPEARDRDGRECFQLFAAALVGEDAQLGGLSGSPVLSGTTVVAMIYRVVAGEGDGKQTRFGMIYAIPITGAHPSLGLEEGGGGGGSMLPDGVRERDWPPPDTKPSAQEAEQLRLFGVLHTASTAGEVVRVLGEWKARAPLPGNVPMVAAEKVLGLGAPRVALSILEGQPDSTRALELSALAYSLLQQHDKARALLAGLPISAESGGIMGGIFKRRYLETGNRAWLQGSFDCYERAFKYEGDPYPGINMAATALWLGNRKFSKSCAVGILDVLNAKPEAERKHWDWATLGEAYLLSGKTAKALPCYGKAVSMAPTHVRDIAVMRKQARLSLEALSRPAHKLEQILFVGGVACFTGHRIDEPGRATPRFPRASVADVARRIRSVIDERHIRFGFSSVANGSDILFVEQLLDAGGEAAVFLPFPKEDFAQTSVGAEWRERFDAVLARVPAANLHIMAGAKPDTEAAQAEAYARCNEEIQRAALEAGRIYDEEPLMIAVLSSADASLLGPIRGGTAEAVRMWTERLHGPLAIIDPAGAALRYRKSPIVDRRRYTSQE